MMKLTVAIITFNEERNIARCLKSVQKIADEIVVVDSGSTDNTEKICAEYGVRFITHPFHGHIEQKNFATAQASNDAVLSLDADEALSDELIQSILKIKDKHLADAYSFNRLTNYCGYWVKHCGWYPDKKLRIYNRKLGNWTGNNPHDKYELKEKGTVVHLKGDLLHYSYYSISEHIQRSNKYSSIAAEAMYKKGNKISIIYIVVKTVSRFIKFYFLRLGFLDGIYGLLISAISANEVLLKYSKLYLLNKNPADRQDAFLK